MVDTTTLDTFARHGSFSLGVVGAVLLIEITGPLTKADIEAMTPVADSFRSRNSKSSAIAFVHRVPMPDAATRESAAALTNKNATGTMSAVVFMAPGFWSTAARSVLTGIYLLSGRQHEHRVYATIDEAVVAAAANVEMPVERLRRAVTAFSSRAQAPVA